MADRRRDARAANVSLGLAALGVATAITGALLSDFRGDVEAGRPRVGLALGPDGAALSIGGAL